jgi:hypothetical protein
MLQEAVTTVARRCDLLIRSGHRAGRPNDPMIRANNLLIRLSCQRASVRRPARPGPSVAPVATVATFQGANKMSNMRPARCGDGGRHNETCGPAARRSKRMGAAGCRRPRGAPEHLLNGPGPAMIWRFRPLVLQWTRHPCRWRPPFRWIAWSWASCACPFSMVVLSANSPEKSREILIFLRKGKALYGVRVLPIVAYASDPARKKLFAKSRLT